jgi:6-phosphogluconate dehydrogenase
MKIGVVGLGIMGLQIARKLIDKGFDVIGFDPQPSLQAREAIDVCENLMQLAREADIVWLMVPAGDAVTACLDELLLHLPANSIIIDGGNSFFKDSIARSERCAQHNVLFLDCGTSGGQHGLENGFSLMIGGSTIAFNRARPLFAALAAPDGFGLVGPAGAGHFVKMVHNGIEYGLLQAYAEGCHILREGPYNNIDLEQVTDIWQNGSVVRSWLLSLAHTVFTRDQKLTDISGSIEENKTGRWTLHTAQEHDIPTPVIKAALDARAWSRQTGGNFATKVVAMLRNAFGGHAVQKKDK